MGSVAGKLLFPLSCKHQRVLCCFPGSASSYANLKAAINEWLLSLKHSTHRTYGIVAIPSLRRARGLGSDPRPFLHWLSSRHQRHIISSPGILYILAPISSYSAEVESLYKDVKGGLASDRKELCKNLYVLGKMWAQRWGLLVLGANAEVSATSPKFTVLCHYTHVTSDEFFVVCPISGHVVLKLAPSLTQPVPCSMPDMPLQKELPVILSHFTKPLARDFPELLWTSLIRWGLGPLTDSGITLDCWRVHSPSRRGLGYVESMKDLKERWSRPKLDYILALGASTFFCSSLSIYWGIRSENYIHQFLQILQGVLKMKNEWVCSRISPLLQRLSNHPLHLKSWLWKHCALPPKIREWLNIEKLSLLVQKKHPPNSNFIQPWPQAGAQGKARRRQVGIMSPLSTFPASHCFQPRQMRFLWI